MIIWLGISSLVIAAASAATLKLQQNDDTLFLRGVAEYETTLTAEDFRRGQVLMASQFASADSDIWDSDAMYSRSRFEGDIANSNLNASTVEAFMNGGAKDLGNGNFYNAIKNRHQLWPKGRIPYTISSQYSSYSRSLIAASMQEYSTHTCIKWVPKENGDANYVHIYPDRGCYSMVGKMGGKQMLSLGSGCIQKGIIIHELMHAVGFFHEQSRTDRDDYITILWNNISPGMQGQFEKYGQGTISDLGTKYDYTSIMHYGGKAFSKNGQPTMVPKQQNAQIGQRSGFSKTDMFKINTLYGCPTDQGGVETTTARPTQPPTTQPPATVQPITSPYTPSPSTPTPPNQRKNLRGDCDNLAFNGWCTRNPSWMNDYCPLSCGPTKPDTSSTLIPEPIPLGTTTKQPLKPTIITTTTTTTTPPAPTPQPVIDTDCEDLRVDCVSLVKRRYCKLSGIFMKSFCSKSCGFCFKPPPTEVPDTHATVRPVPIYPSVVTFSPFVTFRPPK
ncbi:unnamed protein product [Auanema sp. JU1783]|nr:unnamed protein product [Auanema sp. JU1783]